MQTEDWYDSVRQNKDENKNINYDEMGGFDFTDDHHSNENLENLEINNEGYEFYFIF